MLPFVSLVAALLLLLSSASLAYVLDLTVWLFHAPVVVGVQLALRRPFHEAAAVMLLITYLADLMASGPPGVHGLSLTLTFLAVLAIAPRVGGRYLLASILFAFVASLCVDLGTMLLYTLFYPEGGFASIFVLTALPTAVLTAVVCAAYMALLNVVERRWRERTERSVVL
ncbi:MAG: hypothetical protein RBU37_09750 [Myxococcota bacterium]|jgi:hypothetical protein|nr:hypothetical protein [Myxococcota bacterium]